MASPSAELLQRIFAAFRTGEDVDYFFDQLSSPDWIAPLAEAGLFREPPPPIEVDGGFQLPTWSASRYLVRVAAQAPGSVLEVVRALPDSDNTRVRQDVIDILNEVPPALAVEFVKKVVPWVGDRFQLLLPTKAAILMRRLALAGYSEAALTLTTKLFALQPDERERPPDFDISFPAEPVPAIGTYEYERLIEDSVGDLVTGSDFAAFALFAELLDKAMAISASGFSDDRHDYSSIWRKAIEPHEQDQMPSPMNSLVSAVRDSGTQVARAGRGELEDVYAALWAYDWSIHRRIAIEVARQAAPKRSALISRILLDQAVVFDIWLLHEYWNLLHDRFGGLTARQQVRIIEIVREGPADYSDTEGPYDEDIAAALETWQVRLLNAIAEHLTGDDLAWYQRLVGDGRLSEHPDLTSCSSGMWTGPTSPVSDNEFAGMSLDELLGYLETWQPEEGWAKPSREGLGRALTAAVSQSPERFAEHALKFRDLDPTYVNAFLSAFREAVGKGVQFDWRPVLELAKWVVDQDREIPERHSGYGDLDPGWVWTRSTIAHLLDVGFNHGQTEIPIAHRELAWSVLVPLTEDPHPTSSDESRYGGTNMDPSTLAINTVRGEAIEATIKYALWVYRHLEADGVSSDFNASPEARAVLEAHLDTTVDPSYAVHSMYGHWFPWLHLIDAAWTRDHLEQIFPVEEDKYLYWEAAWEAYLSYSQPYNSVYEILRSTYEVAVDRIGRQSPDRKHSLLEPDRIGQHLMIFYLRGLMDIDDPLLRYFFEVAPPALRGSTVRFVGRDLYVITDNEVHSHVRPLEDVIVDRAKALWLSRRSEAEGHRNVAELREELVQFGWWFVAPSLAPHWALDQLQFVLENTGSIEAGHLVVVRLAELVDVGPADVLRSIQLMVRGDKDGWIISGWNDSVMDILRFGLASDRADVRQLAEDVTHELGTKGYRQFRDLLDGPTN